MRRIESHKIPGPAGLLEAVLEEPEDAAPAIAALVCHPHPLYGGTMHNKVVYRLARGVRRAGAVALRFNFRGVGLSEGTHGNFAGEIEDARAALTWLRERYPELPFALSGFSFGSRVVTRLACELTGAQWVIAVGFPTDFGESDYLATCRTPKIFIQSTHDEYGPVPAVQAAFDMAGAPKRLIWVEAEDHFFSNALPVLEERVYEAARDGSEG